jgi:hypothetical protein
MTVGAFHHFMSLICVLAMTRISGILAMEMETMGKPWENHGKLRKTVGNLCLFIGAEVANLT